MKTRHFHWLPVVALLLITGCATPNEQVFSSSSAVELRSFQTRAFDTTDRPNMLRSVIATLQDLGFIIDKTDEDLGLVTGTKLSGYSVRMTVIVQPRGDTQLSVRSSALYNNKVIEEPLPYQNLFAALEKAVFLTAHQID